MTKIKSLLGQSPEEAEKSLAQLQEELRHCIDRKNWVKSFEILMLTAQLQKSVNEFCKTVEDFHKNTTNLTYIRIWEKKPQKVPIFRIINSKRNSIQEGICH